MKPFDLVDCSEFIEDQNVCFDFGEPKGQCLNCGSKWYQHNPNVISDEGDRKSTIVMQKINKEYIQT